jgi:hypothetical protein
VVGKACARYAAKWAPYYGVKYTLIHAVRKYGAPKCYRRLLEANRRLTRDRKQRLYVQQTLKRTFYLPQELFERAKETDQFLWEWANETEEIGSTSSHNSIEADAQLQAAALLGIKTATKGVLLLEGGIGYETAETANRPGIEGENKTPAPAASSWQKIKTE